jgi:hypothetical protein
VRITLAEKGLPLYSNLCTFDYFWIMEPDGYCALQLFESVILRIMILYSYWQNTLSLLQIVRSIYYEQK